MIYQKPLIILTMTIFVLPKEFAMKINMKIRLYRLVYLPVLLLAGLLAGCSTVTSQVTVFHDWPSDVKEKTYTFDKQANQQNNLEYDAYANLVRGKLAQLGFVNLDQPGTANSAPPAFKVALNYHITSSETDVSMPPYAMYGFYDPYWYGFYDPYWPWRYRHFLHGYYSRYPYYFPGPRFGRFGGPIWPPELEVRTWYTHELNIVISDARAGKQLFDIRTNVESMEQTLNKEMPNLVESAFKEFPGLSGTTKTVETKAVN